MDETSRKMLDEARSKARKKSGVYAVFCGFWCSAIIFFMIGNALFGSVFSGVNYTSDGHCDVCGASGGYVIERSFLDAPKVILEVCYTHALEYAWVNPSRFEDSTFSIQGLLLLIGAYIFIIVTVLLYQLFYWLFKPSINYS